MEAQVDAEAKKNKKDRRLEHLLQVGSEMTAGLAAAGIGLLIHGAEGALAGGLAGPAISHVMQKIGGEVSRRVLSQREEKRVGAVLLYAARKAEANAETGKTLRNDGFFEERVDERSAADEIVEGTLLVSQREYEERKIPFYGNLLGNIGFSYVDRGYANLLLRTAERLSYRQLCLLHIVENYTRLGLSHQTFREREGNAAEAGSIPNFV